MIGEVDAKRAVHGRRVREQFRQVWLQENHIRPLLVALVVLAPNATPEVVFGSHFVILVFHRLLRTFDAQRRPPLEH
jgi:hypothetical protein